MAKDDLNAEGMYRMTRATLLGLVLCAIAADVVLERQVLADSAPSTAVAATAKPDFGLMAQAWNLFARNYVERAAIRQRRMTYAAIRSMVGSLGDTGHSVFLTPQMAREDTEQLRGRFPGIGAEVRARDKQVVVVAPLDGSPAQMAGLHAGDIIFKFDGKDVSGETLQTVVREIRGPAGTTVVLSIRDPRTDQTRRVSIVRAVIRVRSVS